MSHHAPSRTSLVTNGLAVEDIPGLRRSETVSLEDLKAQLAAMTKETYSHEEIFGRFCHTAEFIECPVDMAFEYMSNVYCLEEFTFSLRNFEYIGGNLYRGTEALAKDTFIYMRVDAYPDSRVVDHLCAWDQGSDLWMRYHFRFLDAMPTINRPGTLVTWTNCRHAYYDRGVSNVPTYISEPRERTDRLWVGDIWPSFYAIHNIEAANLKAILERRFSHR